LLKNNVKEALQEEVEPFRGNALTIAEVSKMSKVV
jgi:hypothetical protein